MPDYGEHAIYIYLAYGISILALAGLIVFTLRGGRD